MRTREEIYIHELAKKIEHLRKQSKTPEIEGEIDGYVATLCRQIIDITYEPTSFPGLKEAKTHLHAQACDKGGKCPVCGQFVKFYKRKLYKSPLQALKNLYDYEGRWLHVNSFDRNACISLLKYWDLATEKLNSDEKKNSGMWKITSKGVKFINNEISIPKYAYIYNSKLLKYSDEHVYIDQLNSKNFNYAKMMSGDFYG